MAYEDVSDKQQILFKLAQEVVRLVMLLIVVVVDFLPFKKFASSNGKNDQDDVYQLSGKRIHLSNCMKILTEVLLANVCQYATQFST